MLAVRAVFDVRTASSVGAAPPALLVEGIEEFAVDIVYRQAADQWADVVAGE
jgi:hypothetical protein